MTELDADRLHIVMRLDHLGQAEIRPAEGTQPQPALQGPTCPGQRQVDRRPQIDLTSLQRTTGSSIGMLPGCCHDSHPPPS